MAERKPSGSTVVDSINFAYPGSLESPSGEGEPRETFEHVVSRMEKLERCFRLRSGPVENGCGVHTQRRVINWRFFAAKGDATPAARGPSAAGM